MGSSTRVMRGTAASIGRAAQRCAARSWRADQRPGSRDGARRPRGRDVRGAALQRTAQRRDANSCRAVQQH
eukprot:5841003-Pyramimonas_sp.AAC.1